MAKSDLEEYRRSHIGEVAGSYDHTLFRPGTYNYETWQKEQRLLAELLTDWVGTRERYLDFACGTGRVLAFLEGKFTESVGVDISSDMLKEAAARGVSSDLICGDVTRDGALVSGRFDCITAFRFFLNAEPELRDQAMAFLASRLQSRESVLIFNVHGNRASTYGLSVLLKRLLGRRHRLMGMGEIRRLVEAHGLEIVAWRGINYFDTACFKYMPTFLWRALEALLRPFTILERFSVYLYFVCRVRR